DLEVNINGVKREALKHNVPEPQVFAVSALRELEGNETDSGVLPLREFLQDNITGINAFRLKIGNLLDMVSTLNEKIHMGLQTRKAQYESDVAFREDVDETLRQHVEKSQNQVETLI